MWAAGIDSREPLSLCNDREIVIICKNICALFTYLFKIIYAAAAGDTGSGSEGQS